MKLLVVIVSYRVADLTIECLRSLGDEIGRIPGARVVVCENGTGDNSAERLGDAISANGWSSWAELVAIYPNRGFTGGNNAVIEPALNSDDPPEYILLLNADTTVEAHSLTSLVAFMDEHPRAGIAGSRLLSPAKEVQASPFRFPGVISEFDRGLRLGIVSRLLSPWSVVLPQLDQPSKVHWVAGASMILRREMVEQVGLLDEGLYTYFDDADICLRAARLGWETWHVPESRIVHLEGASTGVVTRGPQKRRPAYWHQARRRFFLKNHGACYAALADAGFILGCTIWHARRLLLRKPNTDPPYMLSDSIRHSVFRTGVKVSVVENPAFRNTDTDLALAHP